jgi:hypothetical protein
MSLVPASLGLALGRNALTLQKHAPQILFSAGVVGTVTSTVLACRATLKVDAVLEEAKERRQLVHSTFEDIQTLDYSKKDRDQDLTKLQVQTTIRIVKLYMPAVIVGGLSIAALTGSNRLLMNRNAALGAAYTALDKGFREYRARVVEKYGPDEDRNFRYGTEMVEVEDGEGKKKKEVVRISRNQPSIYAKFFDASSVYFEKHPESNLIFLKAQQNFANDRLKTRGHLFLNEVYDALGLPHTKAGSAVGWLLSRDGSTDNYVSFGLFEGQEQKIRDFVNGYDEAVLLDFNVDGPILNMLEEH